MPQRPLRAAAVTLALATAGAVIPFASTPASALGLNSPLVVDRATDANGGQFAGGTIDGKISPGGRWFGFDRPSAGTYLKDLVSGATELVSLNPQGKPADQASTLVGLSADGNKVLFSTASSNMGLGAPTALDLYVRDRAGKQTTRVNYLPGSSTPTAVQFGQGAIDDNGFNVVFTTLSSNHVYRRTLNPGTTQQVDVTTAEIPGGGVANQPAISGNGRFVTFTSTSTTLVAGDTNNVADIFERDTQLTTTTRVSTGDDGQANHASSWSAVNADGTKVAFQSDADNLVGGDVNVVTDVFERNVTTASTFLVSQGSLGEKGNGPSTRPDLDGTGEHVVFQSTASTFESPNNFASDVFGRDLGEGFTFRLGGLNAPSQSPDAGSRNVSMTTDGTGIAFDSSATNLVGSFDTNGEDDAFVERNEPIGPWSTVSDLTQQMAAAFDATGPNINGQVLDVLYGRVTPTHLISTFAHAPAWAEDREPVARLYQSFFLRRPDTAGLNHWVNKHEGGLSLSKIAGEFARSSEFKTKYGNVSNTAFVNLVYGNVLQRKPDAAGLAHWVKKLDGGMSRGDVMVQFSESSEGKRFLAPWVDATVIGMGLFDGKIPNQTTYDDAVAARVTFGHPEDAALSYLTSDAYVALKGGKK